MTPARRKLAVVTAAVAVAAGTFVVLSPGGDDDREARRATTTGAPSPSAATTTPRTTPVRPDVVTVRLLGGEPVGGIKSIEVNRGERVRLDVRSDTVQEIHVHGFDLTATAAPGSPARFRFKADVDGRFEVETHATSTVVAEISVSP